MNSKIYTKFNYGVKVSKVVPNFSLLWEKDPHVFKYSIKWFDIRSWWILLKNWIYRIDLKVIEIKDKKYFLIFDDINNNVMYCLEYELYFNTLKKIRQEIKKYMYQLHASYWKKKYVLNTISYQHIIQYLENKYEFEKSLNTQINQFTQETCH